VTAAREWTPYGVEMGDAQPGLGYAHGYTLRACLRGASGLMRRWGCSTCGRDGMIAMRDGLQVKIPYRSLNNLKP